MNNREAAYALLRATLGMIFLTTGIAKLNIGVGNFARLLLQGFAGKLPTFVVAPFAYALPFVEAALGALLVAGLFNRIALVASGVLSIVLTFGKVVENDVATVAHNLIYAVINFLLLSLAEQNSYSVDRLRRKA